MFDLNSLKKMSDEDLSEISAQVVGEMVNRGLLGIALQPGAAGNDVLSFLDNSQVSHIVREGAHFNIVVAKA